MSTPVTNPAPQTKTATPVTRTRAARTPMPDDGTRQLLQGAFWTLLVGLLAGAATKLDRKSVV